MITGASQHHVAVVACIATRRGLNVSPGQFRPSCHPTARKQYSTRSARQQANHSYTILPSHCISQEPKFPDLSLSPQPRNTEVDLSKTRPLTLESPAALDPKNYPSTNGTPPLTDRAKHLFRTGKAYLKFYKTGFSNVWNAYKQARSIRTKYAPHKLDIIAKYGGQIRHDQRLPTTSQAEYQLCMRSRHDVLKLIPFSLVFAICGEFTPLVVIALGTAVVPYPCRIPRQEASDIQKKIEKHETYTALLAEYQAGDDPEQAKGRSAETLIPTWQQEWLEAYRYNLTSLRPLPIIGAAWNKFILQPKLKRHCDEILCNTILIRREGGFRNLDPRSIYEWADKCNLDALRKYVERKVKEKTPTSIEDLCTRDLKDQIAAECDAEAKVILDRDWTRIDPECHWRTVCRFDAKPNAVRKRELKDGEVQAKSHQK